MAAFILLLVGAALAIIGVALLSIPAALIVAGVGVTVFALLADLDTFGRSRT